uniref:Uncharacterized protein n=1 Tax=Anguilla anguilla TaxID=7936 RepID=A0A0E9X4B1_ANGAN
MSMVTLTTLLFFNIHTNWESTTGQARERFFFSSGLVTKAVNLKYFEKCDLVLICAAS